jgi:hypothetical protein
MNAQELGISKEQFDQLLKLLAEMLKRPDSNEDEHISSVVHGRITITSADVSSGIYNIHVQCSNLNLTARLNEEKTDGTFETNLSTGNITGMTGLSPKPFDEDPLVAI